MAVKGSIYKISADGAFGKAVRQHVSSVYPGHTRKEATVGELMEPENVPE